MTKRSTYRTHQKDFEKYFGDNMTDHERHDLERQSLEDAFEEEAMEGWAQVPVSKATNDLSDLRKRLSPSKGGFSWLKIAAAIALLVLTSLLIFLNQDQEPLALAQDTGIENSDRKTLSPINQPETEPTTSTENAKQMVSSTPGSEQNNDRNNLVASNDTVEPDENLLDIQTESISLLARSESPEDRDTAPTASEISEEQVESQVPVPIMRDQTLSATQMRPETKTMGKLYEGAPVASKEDKSWTFFQVRGHVFDEKGNRIPEARIVLDGTSILAVSDFEGKFEIAIPDSLINPQLVFSSVDHEPIRYDIDRIDSINVVMISRNRTSLARTEKLSRAATPKGGFKKYEKYLKNNIRTPDIAKRQNVKGTVLLSLTIGTNGQITEVIVLKGLTAACDKEAIRLVQEGPSWIPAKSEDRAIESQAGVEVKFD